MFDLAGERAHDEKCDKGPTERGAKIHSPLCGQWTHRLIASLDGANSNDLLEVRRPTHSIALFSGDARDVPGSKEVQEAMMDYLNVHWSLCGRARFQYLSALFLQKACRDNISRINLFKMHH